MKKKSKSIATENDPFYERERKKYKTPIASREYIMQIFERHGRPISQTVLIETLNIQGEEAQAALGFRLRAMVRDGQLMQDRRGRYCLVRHLNVRRGRVQGHPDGYGFFIPEDDSEDMMLSPREMRAVMHGDLVLAYQSGVDRRGRLIGKIHEVVERAHLTIVGRFHSEHGVSFVVPDNKRLSQDISIPPENALLAKHGQIVLVEVLAYPDKYRQAVGKIVHVLGEHMAPGMEVDVAILSHAIPVEWPDNVLMEAANIPQDVEPESLSGRADLRHLPFVTIDGADARDFDDAVYCKARQQGGFQLYVAIADVSHYVTRGSALDKEAEKRGNSVYFPGRVVPMLPEALSNGICSLNPKVDRLCLVAEMTITGSGKVSRSRFYRAVIHSHARLTYDQVATWLEDEKADVDHAALWPVLAELSQLYGVLRKDRIKRGALDFNTTETQIIFDDQAKIKCIVPVVRNDAHRLIEECMLAANVAAADFVKRAKIPALYRVHAAPVDDKISELREFLGEFGLSLLGGKTPRPKDFQSTLDAVDGRADSHLIETVMLRSLKQAEYLELPEEHFGLAYKAYTHFTSPIRRYPDLLIHRAIGYLIDNQPPEDFYYSFETMGQKGKHCSQTERRADEATRQVLSWLKCEHMQDKLGQVFSGRISSVTSFGIFVELDDIYAEGLVHVTSLKSDYYDYDPVRHRLVGTRGGQVYRLGDKMKVLVARVDLDERKIDFEPAEESGEGKTHG